MDTRLGLLLLMLLLLLLMMMLLLLLLLLMLLLLLRVLRVLLLLLRELPLLLGRRRRGRAGSGSRPGSRGLEGSASRASAHARGGRHPHHAPLALASRPSAGDDAGGRAELAGGRRRRRDASGPRGENAESGMKTMPTEGPRGGDDGVGTPGPGDGGGCNRPGRHPAHHAERRGAAHLRTRRGGGARAAEGHARAAARDSVDSLLWRRTETGGFSNASVRGSRGSGSSRGRGRPAVDGRDEGRAGGRGAASRVVRNRTARRVVATRKTLKRPFPSHDEGGVERERALLVSVENFGSHRRPYSTRKARL